MSDPANQLTLKSINQLFKYNFFIPAYQRGYRWTGTQVVQLLDDIWQFSPNDGKKSGEFYCLQPIVVKKKNDKLFEIIDGQQRFTTIFLIIKYLEGLSPDYFKNISFLPPSYETKGYITDFLDNVKTKTDDEAKNNIDCFHILKAYRKIEKWFEKFEKNEDSAFGFTNTLLGCIIEEKEGSQIDIANNVRVIWYEINEDEKNDSIDIFTRLNDGKIPLTNAELIKALFLQKRNLAEEEEKANLKQIQIASEWETIEKTLQDDAFWFFIYNPENPLKYDNRIEYIFDLMKGRTKEFEYYHTFNGFLDDFSNNKKDDKPDIDTIWLTIKKYFLTFEDWFKDDVLFHYIGYLIACINKDKNETKHTKNIIETIKTLREKSSEKTKIEFKEYLSGQKSSYLLPSAVKQSLPAVRIAQNAPFSYS